MATRPALASVCVALLAAACAAGGSSPAPTAPSGEIELTVFAAASLRGALDAAVPAYEAATPGVTLTVSTDSSTALRTLIEQGAPADVFLAADATNPQALVEAGLAAGTATAFAGNALTIIVPAANPAGITGPFDLAGDDVRIIAAGDAVPITRYATQLVDRLAGEPAAPAGFAAAYAANIVSREDNVAAVRAKIELGEGDAAIVYATDATASGDEVMAIAVPVSAQVSVTYAGVVVGRSDDIDAAAAFLAWLAGADGQAILADAGFLPPPP